MTGEDGAVWDAALRILAARDHSEGEMREKLLVRRFEPEQVEDCIERLYEENLLDDLRFAEQKARSMAARGKSGLEIRQKLRSLGIDREVAAEAVDALDCDWAEQAAAVVRKNYAGKLLAGEDAKVMAAMNRRGFSRADAINAIEQVRGEME